MNEHWPSTKALSVYNALRGMGTMTRAQVRSFLASHGWDVSEEYVSIGATYLLNNGFVRDDGGVLSPAHTLNGVPRALVRTNNDADLEVAK